MCGLIACFGFITVLYFTMISTSTVNAQTQNNTAHWVKGPYYIVAARNAEEASKKKPTEYIQIEYDSNSGLIRLSNWDRDASGSDLGH